MQYVSKQYNKNGKIKMAKMQDGSTRIWKYNKAGDLIKTDWGNGKVETWKYDKPNQPTMHKIVNNGDVYKLVYAYDVIEGESYTRITADTNGISESWEYVVIKGVVYISEYKKVDTKTMGESEVLRSNNYTYDCDGNVVKEITQLTPYVEPVVTFFTYDHHGRKVAQIDVKTGFLQEWAYRDGAYEHYQYSNSNGIVTIVNSL